ncbi:ParB/RepB/Spo0J family partition protein [Candidatus Giovannonibacteria bacterium]|nr:ParB/RepB/Spo0J family partition protein [Candidatus Giovannonibacteria bacterium]
MAQPATALQEEIRKKLENLEVVCLDTSLVRPLKGQPREYFNLDKIKRLAGTIETMTQIQPAIVREIDDPDDPGHKYELGDGERRWRACRIIARKLKAVIVDMPDDEEFYELAAVSNLGREDYTHMEAARALKRIQEARERKNGKCTVQELAVRFSKSPSWVVQHLVLCDLAPELERFLDPELPKKEQLKFSIAKALVVLPLEEQVQNWKYIREQKLRFFPALQYIRKRAAELGIAPKRKRNPRSDYRVMLSFLSQTTGKGAALAVIPPERFRQMLAPRTPGEMIKLKEIFNGCADVMNAVSARIIETQPKR